MTETSNHNLAWSNQNYVLFGNDKHLQIIRNLPNYVFILQYQDKLLLTQQKNYGHKNWIFPQISIDPDRQNMTDYLKKLVKQKWQTNAIAINNLGTLYPAESDMSALDVLVLIKTDNTPKGGLLLGKDELMHFVGNNSIKDSVTLGSLLNYQTWQNKKAMA